MILIGLGANLNHPVFGSPRASCEAALGELTDNGIKVARRSRWFESAPVPPSDQPWFVNGVAQLETELRPDRLLAILHGVENVFGRVRRERNEARVLDLDLLAYDDLVSGPDAVPVIPHPRLTDRAFVVLPLADIAPDWHHPVTGISAQAYADRLADPSFIRPIDETAAG